VFIRRLVPLLAGVLILPSCSLDVPGDVGSIVLYLEVDKGTLPVDETVTVTVTARNVGYDPITLTGPSDCLLYIQILSSSGLVIHESDDNCTGAEVTEPLDAGNDKVMVFTWDGTTSAGARAASGLYNIRGIARVTGNPYLGPPLTIAVE
jgi:hypothetical protein